MSASSISIEEFACHDSARFESLITELLPLMHAAQPAIARSRALLDWRYRLSPAGSGSIWTIREQGHLAAMMGVIPLRLRVGNKSVLALSCIDALTHPEYRNRGYLNHLGQTTLKHICETADAGLCFPNQYSINTAQRVGWISLCEEPLWIKNVSKAASISGESSLAIIPLSGPFDQTTSRQFAESDFHISLERSAAYLNWRYSKPSQQYFCFTIGDGDGLLVAKTYGASTDRVLNICELILSRRTEQHLHDVLMFCEQLAITHGATRLTAWLSEGHSYQKAFQSCDFLPEHNGRQITIWAADQLKSDLLEQSKWHLSQGDSDAY